MTPIHSGLCEASMDEPINYLDAPLRNYRQAVIDHIAWHERRICDCLNGLGEDLDLAWHQKERDRLKRELDEMGDE